MATLDTPVDVTLKLLFIGDTGSGKSCLLHRFVENRFKKDTGHTIGVEFGTKTVEASGKAVKLQVWDTAGQERFRSVTRNYYRSSAGIMLVYDITSRDTYNNVSRWLTDARDLAPANAIIVLIGNKVDLEDEREVTFLEASRFAQENDLLFLETSALSGDGVDDVFLKCTTSILAKLASGVIDAAAIGATSVAIDKAPSSASGLCPC
eukprot:TRINITY_DN6489_c0_g1_i1.p1 TRINITY_DN6489_c0_g1~~TRINITY_DN6489_c0_g1_i1.p1  ORF type:complete len:236 (+),score=22.09 TRINITY_DN6489_c0_g1_i1:88-708(+)